MGTALSEFKAPIEPEVILEHMRETKALEYLQQVTGNVGGWLGCRDIKPEDMQKEIESGLIAYMASAENDSQHPIWKSYNRTKDKWARAE